jgi:hypothetical protein
MPSARRLHALLCLVLFTGTGVGAPLLDAALFHQGDRALRPHVETRDNPACHGERCALQLCQTTSGSVPAVVAAAPVAVVVSSAEVLPHVCAVRDAAPAGTRNSRAPPLLSA